MKPTSIIVAFALSGPSAAYLIPRTPPCCFELTASGPGFYESPVEQLPDGQARIGQSGLPGASKFCLSHGGLKDSSGRGCIITPPTSQLQCDAGASPSPGFSIDSNGVLAHNGSTTFYASPTGQNGGYNIYTVPLPGQIHEGVVLSTKGNMCASRKPSSSAIYPPPSAPPPITTYASSTIPPPPSTSAVPPPPPPSSSPPPPPPPPPPSSSSVAPPSSPPPPPPPQSYSPTLPSPPSSEVPTPPTTPPAPVQTSVSSSITTDTEPCTTTTTPLPSSLPLPPPSPPPPPPPPPSSSSAPPPPPPPPPSSSASSPPLSSSPPPPPPPSASPSAPAPAPPPPPTPPTSSSCPTTLSGPYVTPRLILPLNSSSPSTPSGGPSYFATVSPTLSTVFTFDIPPAYAGHDCSVVFLLPRHAALATSSYTLTGAGEVAVSLLARAAGEGTTWDNVGARDKLVGFEPREGGAWVVSSGPCRAGETVSVVMEAEGKVGLRWFQDWNPAPIGVYVTRC